MVDKVLMRLMALGGKLRSPEQSKVRSTTAMRGT